MAEYMTTREVAKYLRLNEKRIYSLITDERMPAARIGGKWLFPREAIDQWVAGTLRVPGDAVMDSLLEDLLVIQGSDDWLLDQSCERYRRTTGRAVVSARIGSLAGLAAVNDFHAHAAGFHLDDAEVASGPARAAGTCFVVTLFHRCQGLMFDASRTPGLSGLAHVAARNLTLADRQPDSGTYRLTERLLREAGLSRHDLTTVGPFSTHMDVALAVRSGRADAGVGSIQAALQCGLDVLPLADEAFRLAVPARLMGHSRVRSFLEFLIDDIRARAVDAPSGYDVSMSGRLETGAAGVAAVPEPR